ncbi:calcium-activated potassium channel subunit beta-2-like [Salmo salar]|uniref:Calcium-activated potassium channel subunit beta-2-like n=1 Tax=Salmo salar TaxID=8030 RepID=A0ABM3DST3_SALSA|nr:calcium-activated potassium channel subunit beta-2-like [Salmo salar]
MRALSFQPARAAKVRNSRAKSWALLVPCLKWKSLAPAALPSGGWSKTALKRQVNSSKWSGAMSPSLHTAFAYSSALPVRQETRAATLSPPEGAGWSQQPCVTPSVSGSGHKESSERMFLWAGSKGAQGSGSERRTIYQKVREYDVLDKRKTVTALKAGEDRAILLGLSMILFSVMMYFVLGITMVHSYSDRQQYVREHRGRASYTQVSNSLILLPTLPTPMPCSVWTEESSCTVLNSTIVAEINCTYSCGSECWKSSKYPCLQVFVSLNTSGKVVRLSHNEEAQDTNPECFYVPKCQKDFNAIHTVVMKILERLKTQQQVLCYMDPGEQQDSALLTRIYGRLAVFHSLFWPTCSLIGGTIIIAMVKLTQYLSIMCEQLGRIKR